MLMNLRATRVFAYPAPIMERTSERLVAGSVDLRKHYNGLTGLVAATWQRNVLAGGLYLFVNRPRTGCKVLAWDGTGLCIFAKRLERGRVVARCELRRCQSDTADIDDQRACAVY